MSLQFYSAAPFTAQNVMGGTNLHSPQSIFQHTMNQQTSQQSEAPWLRMPQIPPMSMPWSIPSLQQPDLVRFTGEGPLQSCGSFFHHKRKLDAPDVVDTRPAKQFITEEKMSQHFQELHISPHTFDAQKPGPSSSTTDNYQTIGENKIMNLNLLTPSEMNSNSEPKLVISDEIRRLQEEPLLPPSLLSKLERPTMALVLWEPPNKHLRMLAAERETPAPILEDAPDGNNNASNPDNNNDNNGNNNNEGIPNLNQTMDVNFVDSILEPMDL